MLKRSQPICRRLFLKGAGGVSLGLPFLPSLATQQAFAADPTFPSEKFFYALVTDHGAAYNTLMFPDVSTLTQQMTYADAGHAIHWGPLAGQASGTNTVLSPVLTAKTSALSPSMMGKLNVLHGLDVPMKIGHNRGGVLGDFADSDGSMGFGVGDRPTLDQIMAWSPSFYPSVKNIKMRGMFYGPSWGYANTTTQSGTVVKVSTGLRTRDLFDRIFVPAGQTTTAPRKPISDRVLESYRRLRNGNRRLSGGDRLRLDDHIASLSELDRRLNVQPTVRSCQNIPRPTDEAYLYGDGYTYKDFKKFGTLMNDVFAAAFACGTSRIAVVSGFRYETAMPYTGDWHQDIAHQWVNPTSQTYLRDFYSGIFESVFLDLANKLDAIPTTPGRTVLDDSLMMWTQESGMDTHYPISIPVITAGSAGGALKTGNFVDYRNKQSTNVRKLATTLSAEDRTQYFGLSYTQFLATALQALNVPPSEFERWGHKGFGAPGFGTIASVYPEAPVMAYYQNADSKYFQIASNPLPVVGV